MDTDDDEDLQEPEHKRSNTAARMDQDAFVQALGTGAAASGGKEEPKEEEPSELERLLQKQFLSMKRDMKALLKANKEEVTKEIAAQVSTQVSTQIAPVAEKVDKITARQDEQAEQIRALQSQVRLGGSSAGSTRAASDSMIRSFQVFVPGWIQVSGFFKDAPRTIEGRDAAKLSVDKARNMIASLYRVSAARGDIFDKDRTETSLVSNKFGVSKFRVYFATGTAKNTVWEVRSEWTEAFKSKNAELMCQNAFGPYKDTVLGWLVQPAPQDRKRIDETRKATAQFHKRKSVVTASVAFESGGADRAWMYGQANVGSEKHCIGEWTATGNWTLSASQLRRVDASIDAVEWEGALNATR